MSQLHFSSSMNQLIAAAVQLGAHLPSLSCRVLAYRESVPSGLCGSYVSLSGGGGEHIVGLLSRPLAWDALSRALDHDCPAGEVRGIVEGACELSKMVAERFRGRLGVASGCSIGLPLFAEGLVSGGRNSQLRAADIVLGSSLVLLVLLSRTVVSEVSTTLVSEAGAS
jgi:hypothetical protein